MVVIDRIAICGDCLTNVDGDPAMGDGATQAACAQAARGMAEQWPDKDFHIHGAGSEEDSDGWHSSSPCEGCGNRDEGTRYHAVVTVPEGSPHAAQATQ